MSAKEWAGAAEPVVARMREAVMRVVNAGVGAATLANSELLYEALLGYQYLGDCRRVFANLPQPAPSQRLLAEHFDQACTRFLRGTALFTQAVETDRAALLRSAVREALAGDAHVQRVVVKLSP